MSATEPKYSAKLRILTKAELFATCRHSRMLTALMHGERVRLKTFQDIMATAYAVHATRELDAAWIADVGGDQSRLVQMLKAADPDKYHCAVIDTWDTSIGLGTVTRPDLPGVELIECLLGGERSRELIDDGSFDFVTSISVLEHVPNEAVAGFFADSLRICRPGGKIVHLADLHISDRRRSGRGQVYVDALESVCGELPVKPDDWRFRSKYVSNPDNIMFRWGEHGRNGDVRESQQAVVVVVELNHGEPRDSEAGPDALALLEASLGD
jgi:SAM-dependent methyltransferase